MSRTTCTGRMQLDSCWAACCCRGIFQQLKNTLTLPEECKKAAQESKVGYLFAHGERHILPSFFSLLIHLQKQVTPFLACSQSSLVVKWHAFGQAATARPRCWRHFTAPCACCREDDAANPQ